MATVLGNIALLLDVNSPRAIVSDRKPRPLPLDVVLNLHKKEPLLPPYYASLPSKSFDSERENRSNRFVARGRANSKVNGVDFDSDEEGSGNGNGFDDEDGDFDLEKEMRRRVKEIEEMKELEKKAEELQSRAEDGEGEREGGEETEEEKRMRVRKELEKVFFPLFSVRLLSFASSVEVNFPKSTSFVLAMKYEVIG